MIFPVNKRDLTVLAGIADGKKPGATSVVEVSYKDGTLTMSATDAYIIAVVEQPGFTPDEVQKLDIDFESNYLSAESLRSALKEIPRSKKLVYLSIEGNKCEIVTDQSMYEVSMKNIHDEALVSRYAKLRDDHRHMEEPTACTVKSKVLAKAVKAAHELTYSEGMEFRVLKRASAPALQWTSARPDRGYAKVVTIAKYSFEVD